LFWSQTHTNRAGSQQALRAGSRFIEAVTCGFAADRDGVPGMVRRAAEGRSGGWMGTVTVCMRRLFAMVAVALA